jgi:DNA ligase D-like protein (predicted ligase)
LPKNKIFQSLSIDSKAQLKKRDFPTWMPPMNAILTKEHFSHPDWIYEPKWDGQRCLVYSKNHQVKLTSRNKKNINITFPDIEKDFEHQKNTNFIVDGEIVAFKGKNTSFSELQNRMNVKNPKKIQKLLKQKVFIYLFDILYYNGYDVTHLPLIERKKLLTKVIQFKGCIRYTPHIKETGLAYFQKACKKGWEGVMAKNSKAPYQSKRSKDWLKFKCIQEQELVIGGYTEPQGSRIGLGALLVGFYQNNQLHYAGKVGTGYNVQTLKMLIAKLKKIESSKCPFQKGNPPKETVHWVKPQLIAEIGFEEWTKDNKLRQPRYLGLRQDLSPKEVVKENAKRVKA